MSDKQNQCNSKWWSLLLAVIVLVILFFGLRLKDYNQSNRVEWLLDRSGIQVSKYGMAYTDVSGRSHRQKNGEFTDFSIEMVFKPESFQEKGFNLALSLHGGKDSDQLIVGQWQSSIIIMNGDDYDHTRRRPRAVIRTASSAPETLFLTIVAGRDATGVYANGIPVNANNDFLLTIPESDNTLLTLGNSVYGRHPWSGDIYGLAVYGHLLTDRQIEGHLTDWQETKDFSFAQNEDPFLLYLFDEKTGYTVVDHGKGMKNLVISSRVKSLKPQVLSPAWKDFKFNAGFITDSVINLAGFMPLGFVLCALVLHQGRLTAKQGMMITAAGCFILSLAIEMAQSWIPSRSSSMLDLILNTSGGFAGALVARRCWEGWKL